MTKAFDIYIKPDDFASMVQRGQLQWAGQNAEYGWDAGLGMHRVRLEEQLILTGMPMSEVHINRAIENYKQKQEVGSDSLDLPKWWEIEHTPQGEKPAFTSLNDVMPRWPQDFGRGVESVFLGRFDGHDGHRDLYAYRLTPGESWQVLARYGAWPACILAKSVTEIDSKDASPSLWEAKQRTIAKGLIQPDAKPETKADDDDSPRWRAAFTSDTGITFLGRYDTVGGKYDLYAYRDGTPFCMLFARFGDACGDYYAATPDQLSGDNHDALLEARTRAEARGLLKVEVDPFPSHRHGKYLGEKDGIHLYLDGRTLRSFHRLETGEYGITYAISLNSLEMAQEPWPMEAYRRAVARGLIEAPTPTE